MTRVHCADTSCKSNKKGLCTAKNIGLEEMDDSNLQCQEYQSKE